MRAIDAAVAERSVCHLTIGGLAVATQGGSALRAVERVLRHADQRRSSGGLDVKTLAGTAAMLSGGRQVAPARSILRPAA